MTFFEHFITYSDLKQKVVLPVLKNFEVQDPQGMYEKTVLKFKELV